MKEPPRTPLSRRNIAMGIDTSIRFGTPSFPSPLDRIRAVKSSKTCKEGKHVSKKSFDSNQSFPKIYHENSSDELRLENCKVYKKAESAFDIKRKWTSGNSLEFCRKNLDPLSLSKVSGMLRNENSFSFSSYGSRGAFHSKYFSNTNDYITKLSDQSIEWSGRKYVGDLSRSIQQPTFAHSVVNPNKAVLSLDESGNILTFNDMASQLLEYPPTQLTGLNFYHDILIHKKGCKSREDSNGMEALGEVELCLDEDGNGGVLVSGEVVDIFTKGGSQISLSLWLKEINMSETVQKDCGTSQDESPSRYLAILESVEQTVGVIEVSNEGNIISMDENARHIFQLEQNTSDMKAPISKIIPNFETESLKILPKKDKLKIKLTGKTTDAISFPVALCVEHSKLENLQKDTLNPSESNNTFIITVWVYSNISGLMLISKEGLIETCNPTFIHLLLGYRTSDIIGKSITTLIPEFYSDVELPEANNLDNGQTDATEIRINEEMEKLTVNNQDGNKIQNSGKQSASEIVVNNMSYTDTTVKGSARTRLDFSDAPDNVIVGDNKTKVTANSKGGSLEDGIIWFQSHDSEGFAKPLNPTLDKENIIPNNFTSDIKGQRNEISSISKMVTSTPSGRAATGTQHLDLFKESSETLDLDAGYQFEFPQGSFFGWGRHMDGSDINIMYQV